MTREADREAQRNLIERLVVAARARFEDKLHELGRRVEETKEALDVARVIRAHPVAFVGGALAAGAAFAAAVGGGGHPRGRMTSALEAMITGLVVQTARSWLSTRFATLVPRLIDPPGAADRSASEVMH